MKAKKLANDLVANGIMSSKRRIKIRKNIVLAMDEAYNRNINSRHHSRSDLITWTLQYSKGMTILKDLTYEEVEELLSEFDEWLSDIEGMHFE